MNPSISEYFASQNADIPDINDLRCLEAPEPLVRILTACTKLEGDEVYLAHLRHVPHPLFPHLKTRGMQWKVFEQEDDSALLLIRRVA
jgi:hypothetical protein